MSSEAHVRKAASRAARHDHLVARLHRLQLHRGGESLSRRGSDLGADDDRDDIARAVRSRFAPDSPLEEAVLSELVSEDKFPASWENTGNFVCLGLRVRLLARNPAPNSMIHDPIPYASEQGIYFGLAGN